MTRPIPIFRFIFAAYYATVRKWDFEDGSDFKRSGGRAKPDGPTLSLVVNNDLGASPRPCLGLREDARGFKTE